MTWIDKVGGEQRSFAEEDLPGQQGWGIDSVEVTTGASLPGCNHNHEEWQLAQGPEVCEEGGTYLRPWDSMCTAATGKKAPDHRRRGRHGNFDRCYR